MGTQWPPNFDGRRGGTTRATHASWAARLKTMLYAVRHVCALLLANIVVMILVAQMVDLQRNSFEQYYFNLQYEGPEYFGSQQEMQSSVETMLVVASMLLLGLFLMDAVFFYRFAKVVDEQVKALTANGQAEPDEDGSNASGQPQQQGDPLYFGELSQAADRFFCASNSGMDGGHGSTTFLVSLLFVLFSIAISASEFGGLATVLLLSQNVTYCLYTVPSRPNNLFDLQALPKFSFLPDTVQDWINENRENPGKGYIKLPDESLVFVAASQYTEPSLVQYYPNGTLTTFPDFAFPDLRMRDSALYPFPSTEPYSGFCTAGIHRSPRSDPYTRDYGKASVACYANNQMRVQVREDQSGFASDQSTFMVDNHTFWVASIRKSWGAREYVGSARLESFDVYTVERTFLDEMDTVEPRSGVADPRCGNFLLLIAINAAVTLSLVSVYLYCTSISSCLVPVCIGCFFLVYSLNAMTASVLGMLSSCVCVYVLAKKMETWVLWKYFNREMMTWAFYGILLSVLWMILLGFSDWRHPERVPSLALLSITGSIVAGTSVVVLNHPILEILAIVLGIVGILSFICVILRVFAPPLLFLSVVCAIGSFGSWTAGRLVRRYRLHIIVICRRCWRSVQSAYSESTGARSSQESARQE